jgi:hypothetical protein
MPELSPYTYRTVKVDLSAGLTDFEFVFDAEKIVYASPTDGPEIQVRLQLRNNDQIPLRPQGELVAPFQRLYISAAAVSKTIYLLIGSPKEIQLTGRDIAISGLINSRDYLTYCNSLGQLFSAEKFDVVGAGTLNRHQLKNPPGSGKTIELLFAECGSTVNQTLNGYGRGDTNVVSLYRSGANHNIGGAAGIGDFRYGSSGGTITDAWGAFSIAAFIPFKKELAVYLDPGEGFIFEYFNAAAYNCSTRYVWREIPN